MTTKPPVSLRVPQATQDRVAKWAAEQRIPKNAAYVQLVERGLKSVGPHPGLNERPLPPHVKAERKAEREANADTTSNAKLAMHRADAFNARAADGNASTTFGPVRAKPGERFKTGKAKK